MKRRIAMTPKALEARRRNARHSTGPRTPEGKRRSAANSKPARPARAVSAALGRESLHLLAELLRAFEPADAAERLLVEELARLHAAKRRNQEAQEGLIGRHRAKLRRERAQHQRALTLEHSDYPLLMVAAAGFFHMEDGPAKFREISRLLNTVKVDVELGNFSQDAEELLKTIYGPSPTMRGARVMASYRQLLESGVRLPPAITIGPSAPAGSGDAVPKAASCETKSASREWGSQEAARAELLRAIEEEKSILSAQFEAYLDEHLPTPQALERAALVPADNAWRDLIHQDQTLDRQIEKKTRLLHFCQWVRRSKETKEGALYSN